MSLDVTLYVDGEEVYDDNITHNVNRMAKLAGMYAAIWRPDEYGMTKARDLIHPIKDGIKYMLDHRDECEALEPSNGWGSYRGLLRFALDYLYACEDYPDADVGVRR